MNIRKAETKDIHAILSLLSQVLELHAAIRPDIFISGTTKYTEKEVAQIIKDENRRTYVAVDENDTVIGYALCEIKTFTATNNIVPHTEMYIDDLCVADSARGRHIGTRLFEYVKQKAKRLGCYEITLNVWEGNDSARGFYEKMDMKPKSTTMELIL
ncbi:MAG: GNAT family N-acetyltransferase [Clostridia bacterium]|nr:GNAT family N-acetyltransferase [Clostridia bacterium]